MKIAAVDKTLNRLAELIGQGRFEELETDTLEIKSVPADSTGWRQCHKSACAFLNTRGGILILGVKEEGAGAARKYVFTGWQPHAEPNLKEFPRRFTDRDRTTLDLHDAFLPPMLLDFMGGKVAVMLVDELPADRKFVFYQGEAYKRVVTGDQRITEPEIDKQEEFREEALQARELQMLPEVGLADLDLDKLNDYITQLNRPVKVETVKPDLATALPFLERKSFIRDGKATTLGALVCAKHAADVLGFRCQVHGYVDAPQEIARDKQDFADNVLPLMEDSLAYLLRNIQIGVSVAQGGSNRPQYPEQLLRETVNNALAHRDYSINRQVTLEIKPGHHIAIGNPGSFRKYLVIEAPNDALPLRRILPEARPRNPKLADVLRVFRKWEGRGIGMATMVNLCLQNEMDLPFYRFRTEEVTLHLCAGKLVDDRMERLFEAYDAHIGARLEGGQLTDNQKRVLAYLIKSEWANEMVSYTILLTPDNNHFNELVALEAKGLITKHPLSTAMYPIYVADRVLVRKDYVPELRRQFGLMFDGLDDLHKQVLSVVYRYNNFSNKRLVSAKMASFSLWHERGGSAGDIEQFDAFYRKVRRVFKRLADDGFVEKSEGTRGYILKSDAGSDSLRPNAGNQKIFKE
jgi:predicted HTH transcriptional regulator